MSIEKENVQSAVVNVFYDDPVTVASLLGRNAHRYTKVTLYNPYRGTIETCGLRLGGEGNFKKLNLSKFGTHSTVLDKEEYGKKFKVLKYEPMSFEDSFFTDGSNVFVFDLEKGKGYFATVKSVSIHFSLYVLTVGEEEERLHIMDYGSKFVFLREE